jgi:hypothetical protein
MLNYFLASVETLFLLPILVVSSKCCVLQIWDGEVNMIMRGLYSMRELVMFHQDPDRIFLCRGSDLGVAFNSQAQGVT